jgi:hypothetical protein
MIAFAEIIGGQGTGILTLAPVAASRSAISDPKEHSRKMVFTHSEVQLLGQCVDRKLGRTCKERS